MSDDAKKIAQPSSPRFKRSLALYAGAAVLVVMALAYIDGGEEPLHPIVQSVSLAPVAETQR
ncbi:hypothetical protein INR77_08575 [Erythrobacter sp. SCSIO 43205]|uniref:hypothetical protein n=1 Tax=Erythrobacter sp. SCSIO 43205 TaxID=2779361 RepID=UPI001CA99A01|nr:hypothetical protein [Erythrobacter sp. SCSIO 43205]UAB76907.1 hypothetical protein INR77_08575 [Erythrobacter sp. SCSIO 43205]